MDIRCERCLTEYELEDGTVSESGTSVQCTTCGHTFQVRRPGRATPTGAAAAPGEGDLAAEWVLETEGGQVHRFRELGVLQRWIVERKVSRRDRLVQAGQSARSLGDVAELKPFFDILDQANRASALPPGIAPPSARPEPVRIAIGAVDPIAIAPIAIAPMAAEETDIRPVRRGPVKLLVTLGTAALVAYVGITRLPPVVPINPMPPLAVPGTIRGAAWAPLPRTADPARPDEPVVARAEAAPPARVEPAPKPAADPGTSATATLPTPTPPPPSPPSPPPPPPSAPPAVGSPAPVVPYSKLVAEAFKLRDNGALTRAKKLLESALEQQPEGPGALAGMGYVYLDRNRFSTAIDYFKRALQSGPHPTAMFGLGEAYRYAGEPKRAVEAYRRFLAAAPKDRDAAAARRQIRTLSPRSARGEAGPASSILQEGAPGR